MVVEALSEPQRCVIRSAIGMVDDLAGVDVAGPDRVLERAEDQVGVAAV